MEWSMKDQAFKVQFFRFIDAFPMLRTSDAVYEHLMDYMSQPGVNPPDMIKALKHPRETPLLVTENVLGAANAAGCLYARHIGGAL